MTPLARIRDWWRRAVRQPAVWIFWVLLAVYHADGRPHPEIDCVPAPFAAWAVVRTGSLDVSGYETLTRYHNTSCLKTLPDGRVVPMRTPGSVLAVVPVVAPFAAFRVEPFSDLTMHALGKLAAAMHVAGAGAIFFLICRRLAPGGAWPATVLFGLGTCLYSVAAQAIWVHGPATFYLTLALHLLARTDSTSRRAAFFAGLALGMAVLNRPTTGVFALATGLALLLRRDWNVLPLTLGGLIPVSFMLWLNWSFFGSPLVGGYGVEVGLDPPPFALAFFGLLVAPSRGLLVYSPALLLAPLGLIGMWKPTDTQRPYRPLVLLWLLAAVGTLVLFARWYDWRGGWCYGPRFLCECLPILCLFFAIGVDRLTHRWQRIGVWCLVALSVLVHVVGVFGGSEYEAWQRRHDPLMNPDDPYGRCLFEFTDTQIEAHARGLTRKLFPPH